MAMILDSDMNSLGSYCFIPLYFPYQFQRAHTHTHSVVRDFIRIPKPITILFTFFLAFVGLRVFRAHTFFGFCLLWMILGPNICDKVCCNWNMCDVQIVSRCPNKVLFVMKLKFVEFWWFSLLLWLYEFYVATHSWCGFHSDCLRFMISIHINHLLVFDRSNKRFAKRARKNYSFSFFFEL